MILLILEAMIGLKVNLHKSILYLVGNVPNLQELASIMDCQSSLLPISYLGVRLWVPRPPPKLFGTWCWTELVENYPFGREDYFLREAS